MSHGLFDLRTAMLARRRGRERRGFSLVEMLVVITILSTATGGVAMLLHGLWRTERSVREHRIHAAAIFRLGEIMRDDVHGGQLTGELPAADDKLLRLVISLPDQRMVEYTSDTARVDRIVRAEAEIVHRETFFLPHESTAVWKVHESPRRVTLTISIPQGATQVVHAGTRTVEIDAAFPPSGASGEEQP